MDDATPEYEGPWQRIRVIRACGHGEWCRFQVPVALPVAWAGWVDCRRCRPTPPPLPPGICRWRLPVRLVRRP